MTEIYDYLRLLFARVGSPHCPQCGQRIDVLTVQQIVDRILNRPPRTKLLLMAPICRDCTKEMTDHVARLRRDGFIRVRIDGDYVDLGLVEEMDLSNAQNLDVVVDRVAIRDGIKSRVTDSVELALHLGDGRMLVSQVGSDEPEWMSERLACHTCHLSFQKVEPGTFSFNGPQGACPACGGLGYRSQVDPARLVPDSSLSLRHGALAGWGHRGSVSLASELARAVRFFKLDPDVPFAKLDKKVRDGLLYGVPKKGRRAEYVGIVPRIQARLYASDTHPDSDVDVMASTDEGGLTDEELAAFVSEKVCDKCGGRRLRPEALAVKIGEYSIADLSALPLGELRDLLQQWQRNGAGLGEQQQQIAGPMLSAMVERLGFLLDVGLHYLSLDRTSRSLSGGEGQRIRLATQIGSALVGVLYVLDEPSMGLHARDNDRLLGALRRLVNKGNSVLVVEHDRDTMLAADYLIDMGPGAGALGGRIVGAGSPAQLMKQDQSLTGRYLSGKERIAAPSKRRSKPRKFLTINGASAHNLKNIRARFPVGFMTCVTGVSGSGKSTLVVDTLLPAAKSGLYRGKTTSPAYDSVRGLGHFDKVVSITQAPIGRNPRSNPATYTGVFALLRDLFAALPEARARGYKAGRFSFNVKGGRCEACKGDGVLRVDLQFLPDMYVECDVCRGARYNRETLEIKYRGMSIADTLALTVDDAYDVFSAVPKIRERLEGLRRVGLGYLKLGQSATTLSGGEAQRVKLGRELAKRATGRTLYVLDEPTTGLHFGDIQVVVDALHALRDQGNTVVVIEHHLEFIACSDWIIDLGPNGGEEGGYVVSEGTPEHVVADETSVTGQYLRGVLR